MAADEGRRQLRWELADREPDQGALFEQSVFEREPGRGEFRGLEFLHVRAKRIVNDLGATAPFGFRYTINAYRGCSHACTYCFARPTHTYLDLDADRDFEEKIVVKVNAVSRLRHELDRRRWAGDAIAMGTNTDPYQRCEGKYRLTRGLIETLIDHGNPFSVLTKSTLVLRDLDLLALAAGRGLVKVNLSIGTLDEEVWKATEPGTPHPRRRVAAVARLNDAGVPCGVLVAPVLPGLSDRPDQIEAVLRACAGAGAVSTSASLLHLRPGVREVFLSRLAGTHPQLLDDYARRYRDRAYASTADRQHLEATVTAARRRAGSSSGRRSVPQDRGAAAAVAVRSSRVGMTAGDEQLRLC
ncbi:MAG: radical SAM protein [Acidimicrobiia bacterium]